MNSFPSLSSSATSCRQTPPPTKPEFSENTDATARANRCFPCHPSSCRKPRSLGFHLTRATRMGVGMQRFATFRNAFLLPLRHFARHWTIRPPCALGGDGRLRRPNRGMLWPAKRHSTAINWAGETPGRALAAVSACICCGSKGVAVAWGSSSSIAVSFLCRGRGVKEVRHCPPRPGGQGEGKSGHRSPRPPREGGVRVRQGIVPLAREGRVRVRQGIVPLALRERAG